MAEKVSIREELDRHGWGFFQPVGKSMEPLLHGGYSTVVIEKPTGRLKKDDVALCWNPGETPDGGKGFYILHRVIKVRKRDYLTRGDNCFYGESVPEEQVVGVMTGYFNGDTYTPCSDKAYRRYVAWVGRRYAAMWLRLFPGRVKRKLFG